MLAATGLGGRSGFTLASYADLSDRQIVAVLMVSWTDEGELIAEADEARGKEPSGSIAAAGRDLASPEQLGLTEAELQWALSIRPFGPDVRYLSCFWSVWQRRGKTNEEIRKIWAAHLASNN